jgi:Kef-type K+ transport system membrane component KefB
MIPVLLLLALGGLMHAAGTFAPSTMTLAGPELAFGYLLLAAYFTGKLTSRFGLPKLTGYILAGIVTGPEVLALVDKGMTGQLKLVGALATALLALQAGSELDLKAIKPQLRTIRALTVYAVLGTMVIMTGLLLVMTPLVPFLGDLAWPGVIAVAATIAVALSAQSPAVVMALIAETRSDGIVTRTMLATVVIADIIVIVMYGVASSVATAMLSGHADPAAAIGGIAWEIGGSLGIGVAVGFILTWFLVHVGRGIGIFTVMITVVIAEAGAAVHLDPLVIMLAAGIKVRNFSRADVHVLIDGLEAASLPVFLVFFALAGAKLDLDALVQLALPVAIIVTVRATSFYGGSQLACTRTDADPAVKKFAWFGLVPQAGLALALAALVQRTFPEFGDRAFALVVGVVATNEMVAPVVLRLMLLRTGEAGKRTTHDFASDH